MATLAARKIDLSGLAAYVSEVSAGPLDALRGHSERALATSSILERGGRTDAAVLTGGAADWTHAAGRTMELGL
jgi:hypothetical protein